MQLGLGPHAAEGHLAWVTEGEANRQWAQQVEVVADNLLREVTREHLALLLALTCRPIASSSSSAGARAGAGAGADGGSVTASLAAAAQQLGGEGEGGLPVFELMLGGQPAAAQVLVATLVAGMCWPDAEGISKAVQAC
ncbi:Xpo1 domain-containing protein, partial [Haematococcus lacustris]